MRIRGGIITLREACDIVVREIRFILDAATADAARKDGAMLVVQDGLTWVMPTSTVIPPTEDHRSALPVG